MQNRLIFVRIIKIIYRVLDNLHIDFPYLPGYINLA